MKLPVTKALVAGLVVAASLSATLTVAGGSDARAASRGIQVADILNLDIFRRRGFPIATCESRCQEERNRCEDRARNADDRRDCRLSYSICSNDCNVYDSR